MPSGHLCGGIKHFLLYRSVVCHRLATCLLIALFVTDEQSRHDRYNEKADRIYRVNANFKLNGEVLNERLSPAPLGPALTSTYPRVENISSWWLTREEPILVNHGQQNIPEPNSCFADSTLFDVFTLPMVAGDPASALKDPQSIVISATMAEILLPVPAADVIGKHCW